MKEIRYFYAPDAPNTTELPADEAGHALRVLRLGVGDDILLVDGKGCFYGAVITAATGHRCSYRIEKAMPQEPDWQGHLHLAMAPTKLIDRVEWFAEKATEMDTIILLRSFTNSTRMYKTPVAERVYAKEQEHCEFSAVQEDMAGRTACKMFFENGDVDGTGIISLGETVGVIDDVPSCKEIIDGMMAECVTALSRFDA